MHREYIDREFEHDMSDTEIIIRRCNTLIDLTQETLDVLQMILQNQNQAYLISGLTPGNLKDMCGNITCNHHIDYHKLFSGCLVSECECEQFYRKEK